MNYELSERFEAAFNQIHDKLCDLVHEQNNHASFTEVLSKARQEHLVVQQYYDLLKQCSKLRNAIVHRKIKEEFYIAEPHEDVVKELEQLTELFVQPPTALSIASQPVEFFHVNSSMEKLMECIKRTHYSQYPIYQDNTLIGLLTDSDIVDVLASKLQEIPIDQQQPIHELFVFEEQSHMKVVAKSATVIEVEALFKESIVNDQKIEAIIITDKGTADEPPLGLISSWDLIRLRTHQFPLLKHT
ncbi:CBS domain-containing protein [Gracilibacillus sp. S3-1-1]|uniref:CBS domain-containing protein n=1 Tax=Gracilibacillus pellucidus TaxID=3095368 RepID=A0ACC6M645_9BACI|nr:CBS domain-containing protein [Gracilibacillus sp. S3-1-1]MDX8046242.1 CBS domain-containing protein [Gracilibacillus sp. S3-1-1]